MFYYLLHQISHQSQKEHYPEDYNGEYPSFVEDGEEKMVYENHTLKIHSSETDIEIGKEIKEFFFEEINYRDFAWTESWMVIQEIKDINFWRM